MLFKPKEPAVIEQAPGKVAEKPVEWGEKEIAIMSGYIIKAAGLWNHNHPDKVIPENQHAYLMTGLRMAVRELTAEEAYQLSLQRERS